MSQPPFSKLVGRASGVGSLSQQLGMGARPGSKGSSASPTVVDITSTGAFSHTVLSGYSVLVIHVVGGGAGGGAGKSGVANPGSGGGAGGYARKVINASALAGAVLSGS